MIRDMLVVGVRDEGLREKLLEEKKLTLTKAIDKSLAYERARRDNADVSHNIVVDKNVYRMSSKMKNASSQSKQPNKFKSRDQDQNKRCYRCKGQHNHKDCKFIKSECHFCKKMGHIQAACKKKQQGQQATRQKSQ